MGDEALECCWKRAVAVTGSERGQGWRCRDGRDV